MDDPLQKGIAAFRAGNREEARKFTSLALQQNSNDERAWQWAFNISNNDKERIQCLRQVIRINPQNEKANQLLGNLIAPEPLDPQKEKEKLQSLQFDAWFTKRKQDAEQQLSEINAQIELNKKEIIILDDEILLQSFGFYKPHYDLQNSEQYKLRLDQIRDKQEWLVKTEKAVFSPQT